MEIHFRDTIKNGVVVEEAKQITEELCRRWQENHGYTGKVYVGNEPLQFQMLYNAALSESNIFNLLTCYSAFIDYINKALIEYQEKGNRVVYDHLLTLGYAFNSAQGGDHSIYSDNLTVHEEDKNWVDIINKNQEEDLRAIRYIEIKNSGYKNAFASPPTKAHLADIVFKYCQETKQLKVFIPKKYESREMRIKMKLTAGIEPEYVELCTIPDNLLGTLDFGCIYVDRATWRVRDF